VSSETLGQKVSGNAGQAVMWMSRSNEPYLSFFRPELLILLIRLDLSYLAQSIEALVQASITTAISIS
jgi:hypothetical protein